MIDIAAPHAAGCHIQPLVRFTSVIPQPVHPADARTGREFRRQTLECSEIPAELFGRVAIDSMSALRACGHEVLDSPGALCVKGSSKCSWMRRTVLRGSSTLSRSAMSSTCASTEKSPRAWVLRPRLASCSPWSSQSGSHYRVWQWICALASEPRCSPPYSGVADHRSCAIVPFCTWQQMRCPAVGYNPIGVRRDRLR